MDITQPDRNRRMTHGLILSLLVAIVGMGRLEANGKDAIVVAARQPLVQSRHVANQRQKLQNAGPEGAEGEETRGKR